ncbi:hypothetical protein BZH87_22875 [Salmonella enterica]|nr:hypothetical protein [Salmonella enterica]EAX9516363.1 hypothetical protein [Salmonella enterica]EAX9807966.1 hypothetical protein [Salmonella enterica]EBA2180877.1 hypothetical protein [Salmonella enterica]EBA6489982.1 hypothetical protein [Salmonella enterica]
MSTKPAHFSWAGLLNQPTGINMPIKEFLIMKSKTFINFMRAELINTFTTHPCENKLRKAIFICTLLNALNIIGYYILEYRMQILFLLPIVWGGLLAHGTYKRYGDLLRSGSDCALFLVATITSAYLVINTTSDKVEFFESYMKNGFGFLVTYIFAAAASVRFYISAIDLYNSSISFKKSKEK